MNFQAFKSRLFLGRSFSVKNLIIHEKRMISFKPGRFCISVLLKFDLFVLGLEFDPCSVPIAAVLSLCLSPSLEIASGLLNSTI